MFDIARFVVHNHQQALALLHGHLNALLQPVVSPLYRHAVNHHLDVVVLVAVYLHAWRQLPDLAIDANVEVALAAHRLEELAVVALTTLDEWRQDENLLAGIVLLNHLDDLLLGIFHHRFARLIAIGLAGTGKEQTHVVVDFRGGANGRTRILVGGLLLDADDGRQACNLVDVRTLHAAQEVAGIGRERLNIAALPLGKDGVEGQRRLAAAAETRDDGQRVAGYLDVDILQVVDTSTEDLDFFHFDVMGLMSILMGWCCPPY